MIDISAKINNPQSFAENRMPAQTTDGSTVRAALPSAILNTSKA